MKTKGFFAIIMFALAFAFAPSSDCLAASVSSNTAVNVESHEMRQEGPKLNLPKVRIFRQLGSEVPTTPNWADPSSKVIRFHIGKLVIEIRINISIRRE